MKTYSLIAFGLVMAHSLFTSQATGATLKVGDPAPALACGKFVQGEAVKEFSKENIYVVEFWATWCGPCRATIPHLNELHTKLKDKGVVVIGQNVWEKDESLVEPFVKEMADKMAYRVALDDKSKEQKGAMAKTWMEAAGKNGIPCAFIVGKDGKIAWIGHPAGLKEEMLTEVLAGKFDGEKAAKASDAAAERGGKLAAAQNNLMVAMRAKKWEEAEKALTEMAGEMDEAMKKRLDVPRLLILMGQKRTEDANKLAEKMQGENADNAMLQYQIASILLGEEEGGKPNFELAEKCARQAVLKAPDGNKSVCHSLLAKVLYQSGKKEEAVKVMTEAVATAPDEMKKRMQKTLDSYKEGSADPAGKP